MIEFKKDAYESLDTALDTWLGVRQGEVVGYAVEVTPVDGEPFDAFVVGSAPQAWWDNSDFDADTLYDNLASWPVLVRKADNGSPVGEPFVIIARKLAVL